jgi:sugar phosphate permease
MDTNKYSYLAMVFYISYLVFEFPHSWGIQKFPTAKYLSTMVILWGIIVAVTCACQSFVPLIVMRVLLGVFEAAVAPALIIVTTVWYTTQEQPLRTVRDGPIGPCFLAQNLL